MVTTLFGSLLKEMSDSLKLPTTLQPDTRDTCLLHFKNGIEIQMEINEKKACFVMGTLLGSIPSGKFREDVFRAALKENGQFHETPGIFAFSPKMNQLFIFKELPLTDLRGAFIVEKMELFIAKATHWKDSLEKSLVPEVKEIPGGSNIFQMIK